MAENLLEEQANIAIYDPKVKKAQILADLEYVGINPEVIQNRITVVNDPYEAMEKAHAIAVLTEWDEFTTYDWKSVYKNMMKPAFVFDGRDILDIEALTQIGFKPYAIGK